MKAVIRTLYLKMISKGLNEQDYSRNPSLIVKEKEGYYLDENARKQLKVILCGGVFDIIHPGHVFFLEKAALQGDVLIVVIANDSTVKRRKGKKPVHTQMWRSFLINSLKPVDLAVVGDEKNFRKTLEKIKPDLIVYGYDQEIMNTGYPSFKIDEHLNKGTFKSSKIKDRIGREHGK